MKIFICCLTVTLTLLCTKSNAQAKIMFFEVGGPGLASINYDMRFNKSGTGIGGRIGVGGFGLNDETGYAIYIPMTINFLSGKKVSLFEWGGGFTPVFYHGKSGRSILNSSFVHLDIGYRLQPKNSGFVFRATVTPVYNRYGFFPFAGLSFGYKF